MIVRVTGNGGDSRVKDESFDSKVTRRNRVVNNLEVLTTTLARVRPLADAIALVGIRDVRPTCKGAMSECEGQYIRLSREFRCIDSEAQELDQN